MNLTKQSILDMLDEDLTIADIERKLRADYERQLKNIKSVEQEVARNKIKEQEQRKKSSIPKITNIAEQIYNLIFEIHPEFSKKELRDKEEAVNQIASTLSTLLENKYIARDTVLAIDTPSELFDNLKKMFWF